MANKGASALLALSLLGNTTRGMTSSHLRILYLGCVIPILTWGAELWYSGINDTTRLARLERVEYKGLLRVAGAWRSSPRLQLSSLTHCMPLAELIPMRRAQFACRLRMGSLSPLMDTQPFPNQEVPTTHRFLAQRLALALPVDTELVRSTQFPSPWYSHRRHPRIHWDIDPVPRGPDREHRSAYLDSLHTPDRVVIYCDGSFVWRPLDSLDSRSGAASVFFHEDQLLRFARLGLGGFTHSRDAEIQALLLGLEMLRNSDPLLPTPCTEIIFVSDAALALRQIQCTRPQPGH